jgi:outer membrane protein
MRNFAIILLLACLAFTAKAQRFGYMDSDLVLSKMPEYKEVQTELDKFAHTWQQRLQQMRGDLYKMQEAYKSEELLLTPEMKRTRQDSLQMKRDEINSYQERIFGYEGELFRKRIEMMKPIQEKIYKAVEKVCRKKRLEFMFDRAADLVMIYAKETHNYTDYVLEELGLGDPVDTVDGKDGKD